MNKHKYIYFYIGTTAELIKLSPVIKELKKRKIAFKIITSGQTDIRFEELAYYLGNIKADIKIDEKYTLPSVFHFFLWMINTSWKSLFNLHNELKDKNFDNTYFIVHGDTISSLIGAILAKIYRLQLVHIESGMRSYNFLEPFPEEICRCITSSISDISFCPNESVFKKLKKSHGVKVDTINNTTVEICFSSIGDKTISKKYIKGNYCILVLHRQENVLFKKKNSREIVNYIISLIPENVRCVMIAHKVTKKFLHDINYNENTYPFNKITFVPRLPYKQFINLFDGAEFVLTDGGSNQEEAYYLGKPCLVLRNTTEWHMGLNDNIILSKFSKNKIKNFIKNYKSLKRSKIALKSLPSKIIVDTLAKGG